MDPAWSHVRGGDQALEDIAHRRCYKEVVERERLLQYYMDKEEMLNRVWQMPPLFERQASSVPQKPSWPIPFLHKKNQFVTIFLFQLYTLGRK